MTGALRLVTSTVVNVIGVRIVDESTRHQQAENDHQEQHKDSNESQLKSSLLWRDRIRLCSGWLIWIAHRWLPRCLRTMPKYHRRADFLRPRFFAKPGEALPVSSGTGSPIFFFS